MMTQSQQTGCVESFLEVSLKSTRKPAESESPAGEEASKGGQRFWRAGTPSSEYGPDGEIIGLNLSQKQKAFELDERGGGGFANKVLTERKLRQLYTGDDFPPTIEKTKQKLNQKRQSTPNSPATPRKTTTTKEPAVKRMPLTSQENTQNTFEQQEEKTAVGTMSGSGTVPGLGYCKGAMADKMKDLAARGGGKQNSSPDLINKNTSKIKHVRRAHSDDIRDRMVALENAFTKNKFVNVNDRPAMDKSDPNYGRPEEGTKTAERGKKAHSHVHKEILELCEVIFMNGFEQDDHTAIMFFGDLFRLYTRISDKVVGILLRAKKYGLVFFEPEILFQGQDDETPIFLAKAMEEIYLIYNENKGFVMPN